MREIENETEVVPGADAVGATADEVFGMCFDVLVSLMDQETFLPFGVFESGVCGRVDCVERDGEEEAAGKYPVSLADDVFGDGGFVFEDVLAGGFAQVEQGDYFAWEEVG